MNDTFAIVYSGHGNAFLGDLIARRCAAALPIAGRYRCIDMVLSNLTASGVRNVGVIMQRNFQSLLEHIGSGGPWNFNSKGGGVSVLTPFDQGLGTGLYHGFGDALFAKRYYIKRQRAKYCLLLSSDVVYRFDYNSLLRYHIEKDADITLAYSRDSRLKLGDSRDMVNLLIDEQGFVNGTEFANNDAKEGCYNIGACIMERDFLIRLIEDECSHGHYNFFNEIVGNVASRCRIAALEHKGYASRLSTVKSYFDTARDILDNPVRQELFYDNGPIFTQVADTPPVRYLEGSQVENSLFGNGCRIAGKVSDSVIFRGVQIAKEADVQNCVIMQHSVIEEGAYLRNAILDKDVVVKSGVRLVGTPDVPHIVRKGTIVE